MRSTRLQMLLGVSIQVKQAEVYQQRYLTSLSKMLLESVLLSASLPCADVLWQAKGLLE